MVRFNKYNETSQFAGPRHGPAVPRPPQNLDLHYDLSNLVSQARIDAIKTSQTLVFQTFGDSGNDDDHNGGPSKRSTVAAQIEAACEATSGTANEPSFCYHLGDVIYPGGDEAKYEKEFYEPFSGYGKAIVAIPGNHDYYGDRLYSFRDNFIQPVLIEAPSGRPAMNLPWFYWVMNTPVATIIGLGTVSDYVSDHQRHWLERKMIAAAKDKALIIATHYPPYCFDGSNNKGVRTCIERGIFHAQRSPDLVISGHSHNYQRIMTPDYPLLVVGTGGVGTSRVSRSCGGNRSTLQAATDQAYGAATITVDEKSRMITGQFDIAANKDNTKVADAVFDRFSYPMN